MKKRLLFVAALCLGSAFFTATAQNKTLGVGISTPNPNAALHVESPTNNQGFIMPRLTTTQRTGMAALLTAGDKGLMLFDTDLNTIYIWNGTGWKSTADVAGSITISTTGLDTLGRFKINNNSSFSHAVYAETNGDSLSSAVHGNNKGHGFGVFGKSAGSKFASAAVYGEHVGTGDAAGAFRISNSSNPYSALFGETSGTGPAIFGSQKGLGRGGQFQITNTANTNAALRSFTSGTGNSGFFTINNASSTSPGILTTTNGTGAAIVAENAGSGNGFSGLFRNSHAANTYPAIQASTTGTGTGVRVMQNTGPGGGIDVYMQNTSSSSTGLSVQQQGTGTAGTFDITNPVSNATALFASTNGSGGQALSTYSTGNGRAAYFQLNNNASSSPAVTVISNGTGSSRALESFHNGTGDAIYGQANSGSGGNFQNVNSSNTASALFAMTNAAGGHALGLINSAEGSALTIFQGGMKISTVTLSGGGTVTQRAVAYTIDTNTYTLGFSAASGDIFYVFNAGAAGSANFAGISIPQGTGVTIINMGGTLRAF